MTKLESLLRDVRASLWFVPALIVMGAIALAARLVELDTHINRELLINYPRLFGAGAAGSRGMLSAIAGSMLTVAGVTFSLTIAALAQASNQYTPRILRNFMRDRANQTVLGVFVGVFAYCMVVLRTIRSGDEGMFVPSLSVVFGMILALVGIGFLIFFIHHIAASIQASNIIASVAGETINVIDHLFPQELGEADYEEDDDNASQDVNEGLLARATWREVPALASGYIESLDEEALLRFARDHRIIVRMECSIGEFVVEGAPLVSITGDADDKGTAPDEETIRRANDCYSISRHRTIEQDAAFGIRQIVDIALKALSPGVNDTTTAVTCIDYLAAINARLAPRRLASLYRYDAGELRVIAKGRTFEDLLGESFDQIRENAAGNTAVILRLLAALKIIERQTTNKRRLDDITRRVSLLHSLADRTIKTAYDRARITDAVAHVALTLDEQTTSTRTLLPQDTRR
jgi:uncharacterized membrane protein